MKAASYALIVFACCVPVAAEEVYGFRSDSTETQRTRETVYSALLDGANMDEWMAHMTTRPHHAGSPGAKHNADYIAQLFRDWGYDTRIETYHVLFPTPKVRELRQLRPLPFTASLTEQIVGNDAVAEALRNEALPPYNAYAADGEVTGDLVYVNRGVPEDYEELAKRGIDVEGKIVIARYGGSWRGIKAKVAAENGAVGCIIFNDPGDDGYAQGAAYPNGAFKHDSAVQRGSIVDLPMRPGDPLTPGYGATKNAKRLSVEESETIMKIPVLPISSIDAEPLMRTLDGPVAPDSWRGALPVTYRLGGGGGTVIRMKTEFNWDIVPAYNVIAEMRGSERPDEWVIRGNHHDAWVIGARDPMSGLVPMLEQARAFGELAKDGWQPKRTMLFCVWDAEEPGLLGSVEWAEDHAKELREKAVAYINTDGSARGFLGIGGSHALETLAAQVADSVTDPQTGVSVAERRRARALVEGSAEEKKDAKGGAPLRIYALGSGSDYSAFLQHLGVASLNVGFGGEGQGGEYHTCFDTYDHYTRFLDPGFEYGVALADVCGRLTLRLLDADVLPFDFRRTHATITEYADDVVKMADGLRTETEEYNANVEAGRFTLAADPTLPFVAPDPKEPVPFFNFAPLQNALTSLDAAVTDYDAARAEAMKNPEARKRALTKADAALYQSERAFIDEAGLPRRPWFRHRIYAPGFYTGYGVKTLPGVREGIEQRAWQETEEQIVATAKAIERFTKSVEAATEALEAAAK